MKKTLLAVTVLAVTFLAGYVSMHLKVRGLEKVNREARERLELRIADTDAKYRIAQIHSRLGMLILETEQQNFATALKLSTLLFDTVAEEIQKTDNTTRRAALTKLSKQRDVITSALTIASPEAVIKLKQIYADLGKVTISG